MVKEKVIISMVFWVSVVTALAQNNFKLNVVAYERHAQFDWKYNGGDAVYYQINLASEGAAFAEVKKVTTSDYLHFTDANKLETYRVYVTALNGLSQQVALSDTIEVTESTMSDLELMDMVQLATFQYFWDFGHPVSGMARERNTSGDVVTTGGTGFGIMALLAGIENGYISRAQGLQRMLKIVSFLQFADKFHGVFPHWINGKNGDVYPFSQYDNGGDLVETAFLMQGLLSARSFFNAEAAEEEALRKIITKLWEAVEWDFYTKNNSGVLYWHWSPQYEWKINHAIRGYNEALIVYLLAISSPTHSIPATYWTTGWAGGAYKNGLSYYSFPLPVGPAYGGPLFFAHYSYLGFDPRGIKDKFCNYFYQNTQHTLINRAYCIANPLKHKSYSSSCWGITASDDPNGYLAHEPVNRDNGTISPTAALSSWPYTPQYSMDALRYFYFEEGPKLWGKYGFYDAFNPSKNWYADSYLAIDQGPIVVMMQNHRTGLLWTHFMQNPEIGEGLKKIGFVPDISSNSDYEIHKDQFILYPSPSDFGFKIDNADKVLRVNVYDQQGKLVESSSSYQGQILGQSWAKGLYFIHIFSEKGPQILTFVKN